MNYPFHPSEISSRLLAWYAKAGRDLPWRHTRDPYKIWLSEIMLQQTGVKAVIPYYHRFLDRFPDVRTLSAASVDEVISLWAGLGYYSRARNLHVAAKVVMEENGGEFPCSLENLQGLPGVGRSTAGAILSIAWNQKTPVLDGNVRRVLARLFALEEDPRSSAGEKKLWGWAEALTPEDRPHDYAQAIMDLGALLCLPRRPACDRCPLEGLCRSRALGLAQEIPRRRSRKPVPTRTQIALILCRADRHLVFKRPLEGMLGGLWEFPARTVSSEQSPESAAAALLCEFGGSGEPDFAGGIDHAYSHFRLVLRLYRCNLEKSHRVEEEGERRWLTTEELEQWPLHGAHKKVLPLLHRDSEKKLAHTKVRGREDKNYLSQSAEKSEGKRHQTVEYRKGGKFSDKI